MGALFRLVVFIFALGAVGAGTGLLLVQEVRWQSEQEKCLARVAVVEELAAVREQARAAHGSRLRAMVLLGGLGFACVVLMGLFPARPVPAAAPPADLGLRRSEMRGLESLARSNVAQRAELDHEREARHRTEEDLHLQQLLVNQALQDKVRLGRDLHDGLVQNLYAAGLVLETARQRLAGPEVNPEVAVTLLERAKGALNAAIREARGAIGELTPDALGQQDFPAALRALLHHLDAESRVEVQLDLAEGLPVFAPALRVHLLQMVREAASNALRHGAPKRLVIRLHPAADVGGEGVAGRFELTVADDGTGFDPGVVRRGHGLANLQARAGEVGGMLTVDSAPGAGTRVRLLFPAA